MTILVFPSSLETSLAFVEAAKQWGNCVIGASSRADDPYKNYYNSWEQLPFIHEDKFINALQLLIKRYDISSIYTPHAPTYHRLTELLPNFPGIRLHGESPYAKQMQRVTAAQINAQAGLKTITNLSGKPSSISADFLAALLAEAIPLYGECSQEKILGLCAAFADAPKGDVIEIGTFFGKSAYVLNRLAAYFNIGATLVIDPWDAQISVQHDSPLNIQQLSNVWDWNLVFQGFLLTMQARFAAPFNYLRKTSAQAWITYQANQAIASPEFGNTAFANKIAVLHLDGNHDEKMVTEDFKLWSQKIIPAGWIIFDDYEWSQGDGPRQVVNRIKKDWHQRIANFFVAGGAAFIKIK